MNIRILLSGRNYHLADRVPPQLAVPEGSTVDDALDGLARMLPGGQSLPDSCLLALSGTHLGTVARHQNRELRDGDELVLIAPVAGG